MTSVDLRCPACNAHVVAGAEWCTLCYTDLRPAPEPVEQHVPALAQQASAPYVEQVAPEIAELGPKVAPAQAGDEVATDPTDEQRKEAEAAAAAEMMLAQLAAESAMPLKGIAGNLESNSAKIAVIAGGSIVFIAVLVGIMMLLGSILPD